MATKPTAPRVMSGTHGYVYWDNQIVFEVNSAEATIKTDREDVTFSGDMWKDSKLMGVSGEFSIKIERIRGRSLSISLMTPTLSALSAWPFITVGSMTCRFLNSRTERQPRMNSRAASHRLII